MRSLGAASFSPSMGIPVWRESRTTKRPMDASNRASGALTSAALNVASRVSLPVPGRTVTGSGINAGAAANAKEINGAEISVKDNANRSIPSILPHYAISGNLRILHTDLGPIDLQILLPLASKTALAMARGFGDCR